MNEAAICDELIYPALKGRGWGVVEDNRVWHSIIALYSIVEHW